MARNCQKIYSNVLKKIIIEKNMKELTDIKNVKYVLFSKRFRKKLCVKSMCFSRPPHKIWVSMLSSENYNKLTSGSA